MELSRLISHPASPPVKVTVPAWLLWQTFKKSILSVSGNPDLLGCAVSHGSRGQLSRAEPAAVRCAACGPCPRPRRPRRAL